jgi:hypothetical protein
MKFLIDNFGVSNLFGRDNYEYYARISGRILKVEENWIFAFKYPPETLCPRKSVMFIIFITILLIMNFYINILTALFLNYSNAF